MQQSLPHRFGSPFPSHNEEEWTNLEKSIWGTFHNDWNNSVISAVITKSSPLSDILWKHTWNISDKGKIGKPQEELQVWLHTPQLKTFFLQLQNHNWKILYDNGTTNNEGLNINWYGSIAGGKYLGWHGFVVGAQFGQSKWSTNFRLGLTPSVRGLLLQNKTFVYGNKWRYQYINGFQTHRAEWVYSAFQASKSTGTSDVSIRANAGKPGVIVDPLMFLKDITFNYLRQLRPLHSLGFELNLDLTSFKIQKATAIWDWKSASHPNTGFKVAADTDRSLLLASMNDFPGYGRSLFGLKISDFGRQNRFQFGVQLQLNL